MTNLQLNLRKEGAYCFVHYPQSDADGPPMIPLWEYCSCKVRPPKPEIRPCYLNSEGYGLKKLQVNNV